MALRYWNLTLRTYADSWKHSQTDRSRAGWAKLSGLVNHTWQGAEQWLLVGRILPPLPSRHVTVSIWRHSIVPCQRWMLLGEALGCRTLQSTGTPTSARLETPSTEKKLGTGTYVKPCDPASGLIMRMSQGYWETGNRQNMLLGAGKVLSKWSPSLAMEPRKACCAFYPATFPVYHLGSLGPPGCRSVPVLLGSSL